MILIADTAGERLDAFLARSVEGLTRSSAQRLLEEGCVLRHGKPGKKNDKLNMGDRIELTMPEPKEVDIVPTEMPLDIVYEDEDVLVINKPKGLVVHPAAGHQDDTLVNGLLYAMGDDLSGINGELRPGIVHRIDKDTTVVGLAAGWSDPRYICVSRDGGKKINRTKLEITGYETGMGALGNNDIAFIGEWRTTDKGYSWKDMKKRQKRNYVKI